RGSALPPPEDRTPPMAHPIWSRLFSAPAPRASRPSPVRRVRLSVEGLEDRLTPSGGPPTAPSSNQGGFSANSGPGNGSLATTANVPIQQLLSGYPIPPSLGPAPAGTLITANPSAIPV